MIARKAVGKIGGHSKAAHIVDSLNRSVAPHDEERPLVAVGVFESRAHARYERARTRVGHAPREAGASEKEVDLSRANRLLKFQNRVGTHDETLASEGALERFQRGVFQGIPCGGHGYGGETQPQNGGVFGGASGAAQEDEAERRRFHREAEALQECRDTRHRVLPRLGSASAARKDRGKGPEGEKCRDDRHEETEDGADDALLKFAFSARLDHLFGIVEVVEDFDLVAGFEDEFGVVFRPEARLDLPSVRAREAGNLEVHDLNAGAVVAVDVTLLLFDAHDLRRRGNAFGGDAAGFEGLRGAPEGERESREHEDQSDREKEPGHGAFGIAVRHAYIVEVEKRREKNAKKAAA